VPPSSLFGVDIESNIHSSSAALTSLTLYTVAIWVQLCQTGLSHHL